MVLSTPHYNVLILLINSHLQYCVSSWGIAYLTHMSHLQQLQRHVIRLITFNSHLSKQMQFSGLSMYNHYKTFEHKLTKLNQRIVKNKISLGRTLTESNLLNLNPTRFSENNYQLWRKVQTNYGKFTELHYGITLHFIGITFWNQLPTDIKTSISSHSFIN